MKLRNGKQTDTDNQSSQHQPVLYENPVVSTFTASNSIQSPSQSDNLVSSTKKSDTKKSDTKKSDTKQRQIIEFKSHRNTLTRQQRIQISLMNYILITIIFMGGVILHKITNDIPMWWVGLCTLFSYFPLLFEIRWLYQEPNQPLSKRKRKQTTRKSKKSTSSKSSTETSKETSKAASSARIHRRRSAFMPVIAIMCICLLPSCAQADNSEEFIKPKVIKFYVTTGMVYSDTSIGFPPCSQDRCSKSPSSCTMKGILFDDIYNYMIDPEPVLNGDGSKTQECRWIRTSVPSVVPKYTLKAIPGICVHYGGRAIWSIAEYFLTKNTPAHQAAVAAAIGVPADVFSWGAVAYTAWAEKSEANDRRNEEFRIRTQLNQYQFYPMPKHPKILFAEWSEKNVPK